MPGNESKWATAYARFGYGARAADRLGGDPREALDAELSRPGAGLLAAPSLASGEQTLVNLYDRVALINQRHARDDALRPLDQAAPWPSSAALLVPPAGSPKPPPPPNVSVQTLEREAEARLAAAKAAPLGYVERLVAFWSNHFCVSASKNDEVRGLAGAFEREAIRPHVLGRFADMLKAVERHPAMLHYLDNVQSVGPTSPAGRNSKRGLNENLAREILELHTLGVDGGYAQADVTEFARALTGWTVVGPDGRLGPPGAFVFNVNAHEGGARPVLGRDYEDHGFAQANELLDDLARSPATARHIARKFARAFVADDPPPPLVGRLEQTFATTDGDLGALARALIADDLAWDAPATKLRDPWEMLVAATRALDLDPHPPQPWLHVLSVLGQPIWAPPGPNGFSADAATWTSPIGLKARLEAAVTLARRARDAEAPVELMERVLPGASAETREAVAHAESRAQAYALLLMAPEFQRR
jgi:uncharacterized protein (DUF1800 family)